MRVGLFSCLSLNGNALLGNGFYSECHANEVSLLLRHVIIYGEKAWYFSVEFSCFNVVLFSVTQLVTS